VLPSARRHPAEPQGVGVATTRTVPARRGGGGGVGGLLTIVARSYVDLLFTGVCLREWAGEESRKKCNRGGTPAAEDAGERTRRNQMRFDEFRSATWWRSRAGVWDALTRTNHSGVHRGS
jgi:hypothetical protein